MERPVRDIPELDGEYVLLLEEYCNILEETITALRDDYLELLHKHTNIAKHNKDLVEEIQRLIERYSPSTPFKGDV